VSDVVDLIERDHREVEEMFAQFKQSHDRDRALAICDELSELGERFEAAKNGS